MATATTDLAAQWADLERERKKLEDRLAEIKAEQTTLAEQVLEGWAETGQHAASFGDMTVFVRHDFFCTKATGVESETLIEELRRAGLSDLVGETYNAQKLKARVKEWLDDGAVPDGLRGYLNWDTVPRLVARKN